MQGAMNMKRFLNAVGRRVPGLGGLLAAREQLRRINPGHFTSPIPSLDAVRRDAGRIFDRSLRDLPGIDLNVDGQLQLLDELKRFYAEMPFKDEASDAARYSFDNGFFSYSDAIFLYGMVRFARPKRIIEIGSGFSSFAILDTNDRFFGGQIRLTCIEPYAERLRSRLTEQDLRTVEILGAPVEEVEGARFAQLEAGDILFVDSSHVSKVGSDVNHIVFEILPRLARGVLVHFHDVFYPFEYPREWIEEKGYYWNEAYLLRAFLQFNGSFRIRIWNEFLGRFHAGALRAAMPLCMKNTGGSLWLERV
jgi:predicted O-methyltransferase YrrM